MPTGIFTIPQYRGIHYKSPRSLKSCRSVNVRSVIGTTGALILRIGFIRKDITKGEREHGMVDRLGQGEGSSLLYLLIPVDSLSSIICTQHSPYENEGF